MVNPGGGDKMSQKTKILLKWDQNLTKMRPRSKSCENRVYNRVGVKIWVQNMDTKSDLIRVRLLSIFCTSTLAYIGITLPPPLYTGG